MIGGDFPWRYMTRPEIRVLALNGMNTHEVAVIAGVTDDAARWLIADAIHAGHDVKRAEQNSQ